MACSLKKRGQSKSHIVSNGDVDTKIIDDVNHCSNKTKKKHRKHSHLSQSNYQIQSLNSNIEIQNQTLSNEKPIIYRSKCLCDTHYNKQLANRNYNLSVDQLFDLIFGSNEFVEKYRQAQQFYDVATTEWLINEASNYRERTVRYKVPYDSTFTGKGTIYTREKQTIFHEVPGSYYTVETEVYNEGVKFCDTFTLIIRFCLVQTSLIQTNLCVTAQILYNRPVSVVIKPILERSAYSASQDGLKDLNNRLISMVNLKMEQPHSNNDNEITSTVPTNETVHCINQNDISSVRPSSSSSSSFENTRDIRSSESDKIMHIVIFLISILFFLHIYLYMKLRHMDYLVDKLTHSLKL